MYLPARVIGLPFAQTVSDTLRRLRGVPAPPSLSEVTRPRTRRERLMTFATFDAASDDERLARAAALKIAETPPAFARLYLGGPAGSGKTHLLRAIAERVWHCSARRAAYLPGREWVRFFRRSRRNGAAEVFSASCGELDALMIDDVEELAQSRPSQWALAGFLDRRQDLVAAFGGKCPPFHLPLESRLTDRLASGLVLSLPSPRSRLPFLALLKRPTI